MLSYHEGLDNREDVAFPHDEVVGAFEGYFCAGIFAIQDGIARFYGHWFVFFTWSGSDDGSALWFFFSGIGMMMPPAVFSSAGAVSLLPGRGGG